MNLSAPTLGLLMLDMRFPRPPGDIGNPHTFSCKTIKRTVSGANAGTVAHGGALPDSVLQRFIDEARALEAEGADLIATSCGFLSPVQAELAKAVRVPLITSSLWLLPHLRIIHGPEARFGILTFDSRNLSRDHIPDPGPVSIAGFETGQELYRVIANDETELDLDKAQADAIDATKRLCATAGPLAAIVLECTNLPPYREAIAAEAQCPVYDICDLIVWHLAHL